MRLQQSELANQKGIYVHPLVQQGNVVQVKKEPLVFVPTSLHMFWLYGGRITLNQKLLNAPIGNVETVSMYAQVTKPPDSCQSYRGMNNWVSKSILVSCVQLTFFFFKSKHCNCSWNLTKCLLLLPRWVRSHHFTSHFNLNHNLSLNLTKSFLCLNLWPNLSVVTSVHYSFGRYRWIMFKQHMLLLNLEALLRIKADLNTGEAVL